MSNFDSLIIPDNGNHRSTTEDSATMYEYKGIKFQVFKIKNVFGVFVGDDDIAPLFKTKDEAIQYAKDQINNKAAA
jgi:hypothetical protein